MILYKLIRNLLFLLEPELAHQIALNSLRYTPSIFFLKNIHSSPCKVMDLDFPNRVGLAAGLDKNGEYVDALAKVGFGFIEVGTVTPKPQPGNPKPRLFRIPQREALINRMGFNNRGVDYLISQIKKAKYQGILGINIGKNFDTPIEKAVDDYLLCLRRVYEHASYITINVSSPNTPGLRTLQFGEQLDHLLTTLKTEQKSLADKYKRYVPLLVKISPDLEADEVRLISETLIKNSIDGVIATNTTSSRQGVEGLAHAEESGGLSGKPLLEQSTDIIQQLNTHLKGQIPIIASGGILTPEDAKAKFRAGASLIQLYTGFIYQGPSLISESDQ